MLPLVKLALRITSDAYNDQLKLLIAAAFLDLMTAGVSEFTASTADDLVKQAVCTYCMMNFGTPQDYDRLKRSYDEQKAQLSMRSGYTEWGDLSV